MELTELERRHLVESISDAIRSRCENFLMSDEQIEALIECLEILGEPYETDD